eukprot:370425-Amphidinium_carterae.2
MMGEDVEATDLLEPTIDQCPRGMREVDGAIQWQESCACTTNDGQHQEFQKRHKARIGYT